MIEFKKADVNFAEELVVFWRDSFLSAYGDLHKKADIERYFDQSYHLNEAHNVLTDLKYDCLKALRNNRLVGIAIVKNERCPLKPELPASELKQLYLDSSEYGSCLAKNLMNQVFELTKNSKNEYLWLTVSKLNLRAQRFYAKMDFELLGDGESIHVGEEVLPSLIMIRQL